ncbi:MAG: cohesin domain-containing protein [Dehalococcoidia bacterium]|nr:cohesin domain-containing protein [Dehalococcoidia bacterium]
MAVFSLGTALCAIVLVLVAGAATTAYADGPVLAIDVDPAGNTPTSIGTIDTCVSLAKGDSFRVDVLIKDVKDLLAWEIYFQYDPAILEVTQRDVRLFQQANGDSSVYDLSEKVPDTDGFYRVSAADTSYPPSADSGSGVLTELTLSAIGTGTSDVSLGSQDLDGDGKQDRGPFLRDADTNVIGPTVPGTTFFGGEIHGAKVAVDEACPPDSQVGHPSAGSDGAGGVDALYLVAPGLAAAAVAVLGAVILLSRRRARAQSR